MTPILVFAKAPEPGAVKTRLCPPLSATQAAALHRRLVHHTLHTAIRAELGPVNLYCTPDVSHPFFQRCAQDYCIELRPQAGSDLGERMAAAFERTFREAEHALLIGCDCPILTESDLIEAHQALEDGAEATLTPAEDGGYVLIGLRRSLTSSNWRTLFENITWGGENVLEATRQRLSRLGVDWEERPPRWDIDRPEDLSRLIEVFPGLVEEAH
ncbi:MAG: TIGR04282 family arsenosugar biosynthesis glycosyltransferase [Pseudomonadota bacterium]